MPKEERTRKGTLARLRALVPNRSLTPQELKHVTERQASELRRLLDIESDRFPVETIAEIPRVALVPEPSLPSSACAFWTGRNWAILVNTHEAPSRQRFSAAHELHHIISHPNGNRLFGRGNTHSYEAERCADAFAAHLLMPRLLVKRYWGQGPRDVASLSRRFEVSTQAMSYRLMQLGLTEPRSRCASPSQLKSAYLQKAAA